MSQRAFDLSEVVARLVTDARRREGLSRDELAERAGVHETYVGLVERRARQPTLAAAASLAEALGMSLSTLVAEAEENVDNGFAPEVELVHAPPRRHANPDCFADCPLLTGTTGLTGDAIRRAIDAAYHRLDLIDEQLRDSGAPPLVEVVGLHHLPSLLEDVLGSSVARASDGLYAQNGPRQQPSLLPLRHELPELEAKAALETSRPVSGPTVAGAYLVFRFVLVDRTTGYTRGVDARGDTMAVWEVTFGELAESDFHASGADNGKRPTLRKAALDRMEPVYYDPDLLPYAKPTGVYARRARSRA